MNFNKLANSVTENIVKEKRTTNTDFAEWKLKHPEQAASKSAYYHFNKWRKSQGSTATKPVASHTKEIDPIAQDMVDAYIVSNPEATVDDVKSHLQGLNQVPGTKTFNYGTDTVQKMLSLARGEELTSKAEPSIEDLAKEKPGKPIPLTVLGKLLKMKAADRIAYLNKGKTPVSTNPDIEDTEEDEIEDKNLKADPQEFYFYNKLKKAAGEEQDSDEDSLYKNRED